ncbi:MAG: TonB-dependent siderophore receptor [Cyanobacteria bacterium P01_G01_bin.54]
MKKIFLGLLPLSALANCQVSACAIALPAEAQLTAFERFDTNAAVLSFDWLAQSETASITAIGIEATENGIEIIIEAEQLLMTGNSRVVGDALITDIPNAVLDLADPDQADQFAPAEGIALVSIDELPEGGVRLTVTGTKAPPQAQVQTVAGSLVFSVTLGDPILADGSDSIRILVEGEQGSDFYEPRATTGTRTDTPLDEIPQSIQVIPQAVLEDQQAVGLGDALRNASGVVSASIDPRGEKFIIRGFNSTSILRNGFRLLSAGTGNVGYQDLANVEQIEVLKGPSSILSGEAQPGGAINIITKQPLAEPRYEVSLRAGSRNLIEPSFDFTGPLSADGRVLYRLVGLYRNQDSYRGYELPIDRYFIAPTISWAINDRTNLVLEAEYLDEERPNDFLGLPVISGSRVVDVPRDRTTGELRDEADNEIFYIGYRFEHRFSDQWKIRNSFRYSDTDLAFLTDNAFQLNAFFQFIEDPSGDFTRAWSLSQQKFERFEFQTNVVGEFQTGSVEHTLLAGVDFHRSNFTAFSADAGNPLGVFLTGQPTFNIFDPVYGEERPDFGELLKTNEQIRRTFGFYLQEQISFSDDFFLLAGLRYDKVAQDSEDFSDQARDNQRDDDFTHRLGLVYKPIEDLSLYTSHSTTFVPNSGTTRTGEIPEPERGEQFEIGARAELLDGRFLVNLAFFDITKQNVTTSDPNNIGTESFVVITGEQRSRGLELDLIGEILPGWNLVANYALTEAEITEDNDGQQGNTLFGVPETNINLWTSYTIQEGELEGLGVGVGFNYLSPRYGDNDNSFLLDRYFLTNAAISYQRDNWRAALNFKNIFDINYIDSSFIIACFRIYRFLHVVS